MPKDKDLLLQSVDRLTRVIEAAKEMAKEGGKPSPSPGAKPKA